MVNQILGTHGGNQLAIYIYVCMYVCICLYMYVYIYIYCVCKFDDIYISKPYAQLNANVNI